MRLIALMLLFAFPSLGNPAHAEPALWVAQGPHARVYMLGSVHLLRPADAWDGPLLRHALETVSEFWFEVGEPDDPAQTQLLTQQLGIDIMHRLDETLSPIESAQLNQAAQRAGFPSSRPLQMMRPWLAADVLSIQPLLNAGYDQSLGLDRVLRGQALSAGKTVHGFETTEQQLHMLAGMAPTTAIRYLDQTVAESRDQVKQMGGLVAHWLAGEPVGAALTAEMRTRFPDVYRRLIVERNTAWAPRIRTMLDSDHDILVTVGAAHLGGPDSVIALLAKKGAMFQRVAP